ncbi:MAG: hypothetical protein ABIA78_00685 [archaeon]
MYELIIQNKELLKVFYALAVLIVCTVIVIKTDSLFRLSLHQGIRYFRNAFLFYGIGFLIRYGSGVIPFSVVNLFFEFFLIMAGFFLLYSLLWKKIEGSDKPSHSSLVNPKILLFYLMAFVIAFLDHLWSSHNLLFFSQIFLFIIASGISYSNYRRNNQKGKFLKFYFVAMVLSLIAWALNFIAALTFEWNPVILISVYALNIVIFLLFLYGVIKVTKT